MAESRNRKLVRRLLKKIRKDDRTVVPAGHWRLLKGLSPERTACVTKVNEYLAQLKITPESDKAIPSSLHPLVAECRKIGGSTRMKCNARMAAIEKLLHFEGVTVPQKDDAQWRLILQEFGGPVKELESGPEYIKRLRQVNRRQALDEVRKNFLADLEAGVFQKRRPEDIAECLRLNDMPPAPLLVNVDEIAAEAVRKQAYTIF